MEIKIEEAKRKNLNSIVKLNMALADYLRRLDGYYKSGKERKKEFKKWLFKNFGKRDFKVLVAKDGDKILAYGAASIEKSKPNVRPKKIGKLINLYVKEKYRKHGIGKEIFDKFLKWFKSRNIKHIELSVDTRNRIAISAYKKYGFFEFQKKMRLDL
jgi:ribosomal protein S18 acetylase RimI-like enzyme